MKIEIDTKHDSHEEIKKVISMLQHLVGDSQYPSSTSETKPTNIFDDPDSFGGSSISEPQTPSETPPTANLFGMFGSTETPKESEETKEEPKDDIPEVIAY